MLSVEENKYWIWLSKLRLKNKLVISLLEMYKDPKIIFKLKESELKKNKYIKEDEIQKIISLQNKSNIYLYTEYMIKNNINVITIKDKEYPYKLKNIYDYPIVLYFKGNIKLLNKKCIAIVGSRDCTDYGRLVAKKIANELFNKDICVISGLARGIDTYSHIGAIKENAKTIAVLGNGLDDIYPKENKKLSKVILEKGGLILSEYILGTKPEKRNFPERNRIISGLSNGVIVVEAKENSGSLITVDFALEQGKEVFAVPGNITSSNSIGTNNVIKEGANIFTNIDDVLQNI